MCVCMQIPTKRALDAMTLRGLQNLASKFPITGNNNMAVARIVKQDQHERLTIQGPQRTCDVRSWIDL